MTTIETTPGRWFAAGWAIYAENRPIGSALSTFCADTIKDPNLREMNERCGADDKTAAANAVLMAAAPELLAALEDSLVYIEDVLDDPVQLACFKPGVVQRHAKEARDAIAKARGLEGEA